MRSLLQCPVIALLLAAALLAGCGGGATSSGAGQGPGGANQNNNPNLQALTLACVDIEPCPGITLIPPEGLPAPAEGFLPGAQDPETNELLGDYSSTQSAQVEAVTVTPATFALGATVTVNGITVASGSASPPLPLEDGENIIEIVVTAINGQTTRTYRIFVDRISRDNADLAALGLVSGQALAPAFSAETRDYEVTVPNNAGTIQVSMQPVEPSVTIVVPGATIVPVDDGGFRTTPIPVGVGDNPPIEVRVTSLSGNVEQIYRITVTRLGSADLSSIALTGFTLSPPPDDEVALSLETPFAGGTTSYDVMAENRIDSVGILAIALEEATGATVAYEHVLPDATVVDITPAPGEPAEFGLQPFVAEDPDSAVNLVRIRVSHPVGNLSDDEDAEAGERDPVTRTYSVTVIRQPPPLYEAEAYLKPVTAGPGFAFGRSIAFAEDGTVPILAVGAPGANGGSGAVYVFELDNGAWTLRATLDGVEPDPCSDDVETCDPFGYSVALSADGNVLAVGAPSEMTVEPRIIDLQVIDVAEHGGVYLYTRNPDGSWTAPHPLGAFETGIGYRFGHSLAFAQTGPGGPYTLVVGVPGDSGDRPGGVNAGPLVSEDPPEGDEARGAALVYGCEIIAGSLECGEPQALIRPPDTQVSSTPDEFGASLSLSADGNVLAVGAPGTGGGPGTGGDRGVVYVHFRDAGVWGEARQAVRTMTPRAGDEFGRSLSLSATGDRLAIGMPGQLSRTSGVGATVDLTLTEPRSGSVIVFILEEDEEAESAWAQQVFIKPSNTRAGFSFGQSVALSADGRSLTVGAPGENSVATTVDGNQRIDGAINSGAIYQFRSILDPIDDSQPPWCQALVNIPQGQPWCQTAYIKMPNSRAQNGFGASVAQSDGGALVIGGAPGEGSASTGDPAGSGVIMGALYPVDNTEANRGAAFVFRTDEPFEDPEPPPEEPPPEEESEGG